MPEVTETLTTVEDGDTTVNERLSPGGPGPEGQADTASESLSGGSVCPPVETLEPDPESVEGEAPAPKSRKRS